MLNPLDGFSVEELIDKYHLSRECSLYIGFVGDNCLAGLIKKNPPDICYTTNSPIYNNFTVFSQLAASSASVEMAMAFKNHQCRYV